MSTWRATTIELSSTSFGLSSDVFGVFAGESPLERVRRRHAPGFVTMGPKSLSHAEPNGPTARLDLSR